MENHGHSASIGSSQDLAESPKEKTQRVGESVIKLLVKEGYDMLTAQVIFDYVDNAIYKRIGLIPLNREAT